ncbi:MAG TPA: DNA mismatch repair protein MutS, partial [Pirellulales bacterium]
MQSARIGDELARISPAECLLTEEDAPASSPLFPVPSRTMVTRRPHWVFGLDTAQATLQKHFQLASLDGFGFTDSDSPALRAAGAVLDYLCETQKASLAHIDRLTPYRGGELLEIDEASRRSLEITRTIRTGDREGSLLAVIDKTVTPMGARLLADWISNPLTSIAAIQLRQSAVSEFAADDKLREELREQLRGVYDLERLLSRVATGRASPRDLSFVCRTLAALPKLKAKITARKSALLSDLETNLDLCPEIHVRLQSALLEDCPLVAKDGGILRGGYSGDLDRLRDLAAGGKEWIARYQAEQAKATGITNLKVAYNKVFGYYIEITNSQKDKTPATYIRKQTTVNAERYITPELKEYEEQVVTADERAKELEYELFLSLRACVEREARRLQATAAVLAQLDVLSALAELARQRSYVCPTIVDQPILKIVDGRHPVLDIRESQGTFVPNDCLLGDEDGLVALITGPNMAGKSTYIRQVALITLLAQFGSHVPAREATIGIADRIFARVGASDELARGQSTFMVEMTETARILNTATARSLVILDEIGRGT